MILEPPASVQKLQVALQAKAKEAPDYRFYLLYDKLYRKDVLDFAYRCCKANRGAPGVDQQDFEDIEAYGEERWLGELADTLRRKTYRAGSVRRVGLTVNEAKTRVCHLPSERFDFLGYTFGRCYSAKTGRAYLGTRPSKKSLTRIIGAIRECTDRRTTWQEAEALVSQVNRKLVGWANYFSL